MNAEQIARMFGCTPEQARAQYLRCAETLDAMALSAEKKGRKVNGYTAQQLREKAADQRRRAI